MTKELVSIVVPAYNAEAFIERTVQSVLNQTYANIEVIVVDDCSTDATYSLLEKMADAHGGRLRIARNHVNLGVSAATNKGICLATGKFLTFHDHDDIMLSHKIQKCFELLASNREYLGVISTGLYTDENYVSLEKTSSIPEYVKQSPYFVRVFERSFIPTWSMFLRKSLIEGHLFDELIAEGNQDADFFLRLLYLKKKFFYVDEPLLLFRQSQNSLSKQAKSSYKIYKKHTCSDIENLYVSAGYGEEVVPYAKGVVCIYKEEYGEAVCYFLKALQHVNPCNKPIVLFMLASSYFSLSDYEKSISFLKLIEGYEIIPEVLNNIGVCAETISPTSGFKYFVKALSIFPEYQDARRNMDSETKCYTMFPLRKLYIQEHAAIKELI